MTKTVTGFPEAEFRTRITQVQHKMAREGLGALLLTTEADVRYVTGFLTRFWESPTRPWFVVVPASGDIIAVIPSIGADLMRRAGVKDIRTWRSPDYHDDGITLLADALAEVVASGGAIGVPSGNGTQLRMPLNDWQRLNKLLPERRFRDDAGVMCAQRMVKSEAEITKIAHSCAIADRAFARVPEGVRQGMPLEKVFQRFQMLCFEEGADHVPYLAGAAGKAGYTDVISPATPAPLTEGDVLMLDTGLVCDGYFCDFNRNFSVGPARSDTKAAHTRLIDACQAAFEIAVPGRSAADLFHAMDAVVSFGKGGTDAGRFGHGLGMQLTEPPSLIPDDQTPLLPGMVLTLEPSITLGEGRILVHEENIVIRDSGPEWLSTPSGPNMMEIAQ